MAYSLWEHWGFLCPSSVPWLPRKIYPIRCLRSMFATVTVLLLDGGKQKALMASFRCWDIINADTWGGQRILFRGHRRQGMPSCGRQSPSTSAATASYHLAYGSFCLGFLTCGASQMDVVTMLIVSLPACWCQPRSWNLREAVVWKLGSSVHFGTMFEGGTTGTLTWHK